MIEAIVKNPVKVTVGVLLVALFGILAVFRMPWQLTPEVSTPTLTIETTWPGASAYEIEREIVQEQEEQLKGVEGMTKMTSESKDSVGTITMEFAVGSDMREALLKANTRLQQVREYPEDANEPIIKTANLSDRPIAWFILSPRPPSEEQIADFEARHPELKEVLIPVKNTFNNGVAMYRLRELSEKHPALLELLPPERDISKMRKFAEDVIEARFERVKGVSDSQVNGGREEEMQVIIDPQKLAASKITMMDVRNALRGQNKDSSGGDFWQSQRRYVIRTLGQYRTPKDVADTIITYQDNSPVYIRDVGEVQPGFKKADGLVRRFGTERLAINAIRETGANVLDVMDGLKKAVDELNEGPLKLENLVLEQVYDETEYIYAAVGLVQSNIVVGGILTFIVLLVFLQSLRSTIVIGLAIPTSIVGTFLMMFLLGRSLNVISLAGLAFAVGMLVDNAVVVLENIYRYYQLGHHPFTAAVRGTREVIGAVIASTLTTLAVFVPVLFVQEEAGQLFRDIALAISCGIALSLVVSMTLIPTASARILKKDRTDEEGEKGKRHGLSGLLHRGVDILMTPLYVLGNVFVRAIVAINAYLQPSIFMRVVTVVGFATFAFLLSWLLMPKTEYLPTGNRNLVFGILLPPPGYNLDQMISIGKQIEKDLEPYWNLDKESIKNANLEFPAVGDYFFVVRGRTIFMGIRAADPTRAGELKPLVQRVGFKIPGTFVIANQSSLFEQGLAASRSIDIEITGPNLEYIVKDCRTPAEINQKVPPRGLAMLVKQKVEEILPGAQAFPKPSLDLSSPEVHIKPKREQAAEMQMTAEDIGYTVDALIDGAYATDYYIGSTKIDLRIIGKNPFPTKKNDPDMFYRQTQDIDDLPVATRTGELIPLRALAYTNVNSGPEQINHRERERAITIQVSPPQNIALEEAMDRIKKDIVQALIDEGRLRDSQGRSYLITLAGTADKLQATWGALWLNFVVALIITYLLMAALFESWIYPLVIIVSVPLGAVGGFAALALLNNFIYQPLDVLTMLGFVILIGTVVNNPILIVEQALVHIRDDHMTSNRAILESVRNRIRPIFMTTTTTVFGLLPLVLFPGAGSELYRGLGAVVLGGLVVSTIVTLVVVPSFFSLAMQLFEKTEEQIAAEQKDDWDTEPGDLIHSSELVVSPPMPETAPITTHDQAEIAKIQEQNGLPIEGNGVHEVEKNDLLEGPMEIYPTNGPNGQNGKKKSPDDKGKGTFPWIS